MRVPLRSDIARLETTPDVIAAAERALVDVSTGTSLLVFVVGFPR